ncbi:acyl-CoA synthetase (AMP-forming)/AMP-acid ligase II [Kitasatospora sp. MAA4]|uniref:class I adenylate-forming enzyme family protein n=1 Tax=Kitasatospora sp. MAA4 TaxID=3035093 RepID=UPI002475832D|nr:AMP-binding protein [Kitasatospora sp. MAA4]MDH6134181.1 acyl-CoA synthetase (AMP-forming)/AMP-acid ligase II [Kitasatospora sp. MAA4]
MWLGHVVQRGLDRRPDALALRDARRDVSWRRLHREVGALAELLAGHVPPGGRLAVLSGNRVEVLEAYLACAAAGVVAVPVNPALTDREITDILDSVEPSAVLAEPGHADRLGGLRPRLPLLDISTVESLPEATGRIGARAALGDPVAILHTSATTGRAKGVVVDQRSLKLNALSWLADVAPAPGTVFLNAGPLFHGSMVIALDYLAAGGTVCVLDRFTPQGCLAAIERWQVEHAFLVPSMVRLLLDARGLAGADLSTLRLLLHGAAPMPAELAAEAELRLSVRTQTIFGITEGGGPVLSLASDNPVGEPLVPGAVCVGRPMLGTDARLVDERGRPVPPGTIGELEIRGDGLMQGYWKNPEATGEALHDGWLITKDLGYADPEGRIWIVDRRNDLILRGGQNVYPAEIEHVLRQSPNVADVVVVPAPDATWGQSPVAFVQPTAPEAFDEAELLDLCIAGLAAYKRPSRFLRIDRVPRNPAGKALRTELRTLATTSTAENEPEQAQ